MASSFNIQVGMLVAALLCNQATSRGGIVEHDSTVSHNFFNAFNHTVDLLLGDRTLEDIVITGGRCYYFTSHTLDQGGLAPSTIGK